MLTEVLFSLAMFFCLACCYFTECRRYERNLNSIPLRIHVNGTRGKSSVTRLIAAGLRAGGFRVVAKTTGTRARIIFPDGSEQDIKRRGPANIREMIAVTRQAAALGAQALVAECMAVQPELQWFCEHRLIKAHIGVITNIRPDHEDVMGTGIENVAGALCNTIPERGLLVTTPEAGKVISSVAGNAAVNAMIIVDGSGLEPEFLTGFPYEVIDDNIALAIAVCELAGVDRQVALTGMRQASPDAGNVAVQEFHIDCKRVTLVNAFAANDPESTLLLWNRYIAPHRDNPAILLNSRKDRRYRTAQLCSELTKVHKGNYLLAGDADFACSLLLRHGVNPENIYKLPDKPGYSELTSVLRAFPGERITIFGAGNVQGIHNLVFAAADGG